MGRKSKLTPEQWGELEKALLEGESVRAQARKFGISESSIRERMRNVAKTPGVKEVASMIVEANAAKHVAERALSNLPLSAQISAQNLAERLISIGHNLAAAADDGSAIARRLSAIAKTEVQKVDDVDPLATVGHLKSVSTLMNLAKEAAHIPLNLLAANKERMKALGDEPPEVPAAVAGMSASDAARVYQDFIGAG